MQINFYPPLCVEKYILTNFFYFCFSDNLSNAPMQPSRANARSVLNNDYHQNNITTAAEISTTPKTSPKVTGMECPNGKKCNFMISINSEKLHSRLRKIGPIL